LTEHDGVIKPLLRGAPRQVLHWAPRLLGPALVVVRSCTNYG